MHRRAAKRREPCGEFAGTSFTIWTLWPACGWGYIEPIQDHPSGEAALIAKTPSPSFVERAADVTGEAFFVRLHHCAAGTRGNGMPERSGNERKTSSSSARPTKSNARRRTLVTATPAAAYDARVATYAAAFACSEQHEIAALALMLGIITFAVLTSIMSSARAPPPPKPRSLHASRLQRTSPRLIGSVRCCCRNRRSSSPGRLQLSTMQRSSGKRRSSCRHRFPSACWRLGLGSTPNRRAPWSARSRPCAPTEKRSPCRS